MGGLAGAAAGVLAIPQYQPLAKCITLDKKVAVAAIMKDVGLAAFQELVRNAPGVYRWIQSVAVKK